MIISDGYLILTNILSVSISVSAHHPATFASLATLGSPMGLWYKVTKREVRTYRPNGRTLKLETNMIE